jgi:nicotinamidase-related amidase
MQRLFAEPTDWHTPWMQHVLPNVLRLAKAQPAQTIFTRFIPERNAAAASGAWRRYCQRWASMTLDRLDPDLVELVRPLADLVPPATLLDKHVYSPWMEAGLDRCLRERECDSLIVSGGATDVGVLATVLGAVDRGYRIVVATDALCSSSDAVHNAALDLYNNRYGQQIETASTDEILARWQVSAEPKRAAVSLSSRRAESEA